MPLEQAVVLNNDLVRRFQEKNYIGDFEVFEYRKSLKNVNKNTVSGASAWAFYHACRKEKEKALGFFRKSISLRDAEFIGNYLIYARMAGEIDEFIAAISRINGLYVGDKHLLKQRFHAAFITGNIQEVFNTSQCIYNIGDVEDKKSNKRFQKEFKRFLELNNMTNDDFRKLTSLVRTFVDANDLHYESSSVSCDDDKNIFYVAVESDLINRLNFDFSCLVAQCDQFDDRKFKVLVIEREATMISDLAVSINYEDGYYIAECDDIHLVTESKSLEELHDFILELTPDLIELNEIDLDPKNILFNFNFSPAAKESIRGC